MPKLSSKRHENTQRKQVKELYNPWRWQHAHGENAWDVSRDFDLAAGMAPQPTRYKGNRYGQIQRNKDSYRVNILGDWRINMSTQIPTRELIRIFINRPSDWINPIGNNRLRLNNWDHATLSNGIFCVLTGIPIAIYDKEHIFIHPDTPSQYISKQPTHDRYMEYEKAATIVSVCLHQGGITDLHETPYTNPTYFMPYGVEKIINCLQYIDYLKKTPISSWGNQALYHAEVSKSMTAFRKLVDTTILIINEYGGDVAKLVKPLMYLAKSTKINGIEALLPLVGDHIGDELRAEWSAQILINA